MRWQWPHILTALFVWFQTCAPPAAGENVAMPQTGLLVKFKLEVSHDTAADILRRQGATEFAPLQRARIVEEPTLMDRWWVIRFAVGADLREAAATLRAEPGVEVVEIDGTYRALPKRPDSR